jgi:predicted DsbA family dithiol-disulfide isomerase
MECMRFLLLCLSMALAQTPPKAVDWQTTSDLPQVSLSGLSPFQKRAALKALRTQPCLCGCGFQIAECRVKDPACADSRKLAEIVVGAVKEGRDPKQALAESDVVKRHLASARPLEDPIPIPIAGAPAKGPADARVTLVEFSDFECPYCSKAALKVEAILQAYPKDARLVYKHYPLPDHPHAKMAAEAALAAQAQDKFWPMHDKLFANGRRLSAETIAGIAKEIGLDMDKFQADMQSASVKQTLRKDIADGDKVDIAGTPTIFINGKRYNGALELPLVKPILDAELKGKK